jgi:hypothetical protein
MENNLRGELFLTQWQTAIQPAGVNDADLVLF